MNTGNLSETSKKHKILLIEDDEFCAFTVLKVLKKDYDIVHCYSGKEGIEEAKKAEFDLILLDIGLKDMNGSDVLISLREMPVYKNVQIIAVTAYAMLGDKEKFLGLGFTDYIAKPYHISHLKEIVYESIKKSAG